VGHNDGHSNAGARAGECQRLAVISTGRANDASNFRTLSLEAIEKDNAAAYLEGADRRMVLMLHHDLDAKPLPEQRPRILRSRRHALAHQRNYAF
jgi:hypothetical protein